jgi:hypothetical protein
MARKTIRRSEKALDILHNAKDVRSYTLYNCFTCEKVDRLNDYGENWLLKIYKQFKFAKLYKNIGIGGKLGIYTLYIHSNEWYEFTCGEK